MNGAQHDLEVAQRDFEQVQRLVDKEAAPRMELTTAKQRVDEAQIQIHALEEKRKAMAQSASGDHAAAKARLDDAEAAAKLAQLQIDQSVVRSPIEGTVYEFELKPGAYLNTGETVASIGKLDRVRVKVLVDEPDLGHVKMGMPVSITWDAIAGREVEGQKSTRCPPRSRNRGHAQGGRGGVRDSESESRSAAGHQ